MLRSLPWIFSSFLTLWGSRQAASAVADAMVTEEEAGSLSTMALISFSFSRVPWGGGEDG